MLSKPLSGKCLCKLFLAAFLFLALSACVQEDLNPPQPKTPPDGGPWANIPDQETFSFVVIGDTRTGIDVFKQNVEEINLLDPDFVIDTGDLIYGYVNEIQQIEAMWDQFDAIVEGFKVPLVLVAGNHDIWDHQSAQIYQRRYGKTYFSFTHKGVHFVCLDSETIGEDGQPINRIAGDQLQWLANDLAEHKDAKITFVFLHKPLWQNYHIDTENKKDSKEYAHPNKPWWQGYETGEENVKHWMKDVHPLLAKYGVAAVFAGHVHKYIKYPTVDGVHYYVTAGGGAEININESMGDFYHYCLVKVRGNQWQMAVIQTGAVKPDTIVKSEAMKLQEIVAFVPIDLPANGGQTVIDVSLKNFLPEDLTLTIKPVIEAASQWKVEPEVQEALLEAAGPVQAKRFVAMVPSREQAYPVPEFSITFAWADREPITICVKPPVKEIPLKALPVSKCPPAAKPPIIDGKLDDDVWQIAPAFSKFLTPDASGTAKFATQVRSSYDQENIYLSFRCYEPNLDGLVINVNERDGNVYTDDAVEIFVDTNLDRKTYFQLVFNPEAVAYDSLGYDKTWNGLFTAKAGREANAWTLEVAIPWATLGMEPPMPGQQIGFEVVRNRAQSGERTMWSPTYGGNHVPKQFGTLIMGP